MVKTFTSSFVTLGTSETDVYTATSKAMGLLIQAVNTTGSSVNCELWITDDSNVHKACLFPSQLVTAYNGLSDNSKHTFPTGYKIRGTASAESAIYVEVSALEGM